MFSVLLKDVLNRSPLLNRPRPQTSQVNDVALCRATAHPGQQNVLIGHSVSSGAFEELAVAGEGHAGVQRFDPASSDHAAGSLFSAWLQPDTTANLMAPILQLTLVP